MKRVPAILAVVSILILGLLAGSLATHLYYARKFRAGSASSMAGQLFAERLDHDLGLSDEQRAKIGAILDQTREQAGAMRNELRPRIGALMESASERIADVLTDEQRRRFARLRARHRSRAEHFLLGPPGPPGHSGRRPPFWGGRHGPDRGEPPVDRPATNSDEPADEG